MADDNMRDVIEEVAAERRRQMDAEGWTAAHDDEHKDNSLALAAAAYALPPQDRPMRFPAGSGASGIPDWWPWDFKWWKPKGRRRDLIRAAALIVAEIERLDRAANPQSAAGTSEVKP